MWHNGRINIKLNHVKFIDTGEYSVFNVVLRGAGQGCNRVCGGFAET